MAVFYWDSSGDAQMLRAAEAEGLTADDPFLHVDMDEGEPWRAW